MGKKVTHGELMEIMGVSTNTLTKYHRSGMPIFQLTGRGKKNIYDTEDVIMWWVDNEIQKRFGDLNPDGDAVDKEYEQGRLARAQADGKEIENDIKRGELAPVEFISILLGRITSQIASILESIPQKVKRRVPGLSANDIEIIKKEIVKTQNAAAKVEINLEELVRNYVSSKGGVRTTGETRTT